MKRRDLLMGGLASGVLLGTGPATLRALGHSSSGVTGPLSKGDSSKTNTNHSTQVKSVEELMTPETVTAVKKGLAFLANRQVRSGGYEGAFGTAGYSGGVAVCALAGLAFLCGGSTPLAGEYSSHIRRCTNYLVRNVSEKGYISVPSDQSSNMYGHGYAMLYLSQVYGMSGSEIVGEKLRSSIDMTCKVQNDQGGWRYQPSKQPGDLSITICQVMALRAAHEAGIHVAQEVRDKTLDYVYKSQKSDGSFQYMLRGGRVSLALTAAGVVSLYSAGIYEGEKVEKALKWLYDRRPGHGGQASPMNYYYAHYYAVQAMWHAQDLHPDYWNEWYAGIRDELMKKSAGGIWNDASIGKEFATAMACIILQIPYNYVPVFAP